MGSQRCCTNTKIKFSLKKERNHSDADDQMDVGDSAEEQALDIKNKVT